jgi:hypothetical protein
VTAPDAPPRSGSSRAGCVVGNLGYDVSFTLPESYSLLRDRGAANGVHGVSARERLVTVLVTVVVPEAADPEDAAALVADAAVSSALDVVHAVGVEGHLPVAGSLPGLAPDPLDPANTHSGFVSQDAF